MERKSITLPGAPVLGPYSPGMSAQGFAFLSGQIPVDPATNKLVDGGITAQATQALENVKALLHAAGAGFEDVVKSTVFLVDMADFQDMNAVYAHYFKTPYPARTTIGIAALPLGARVEVEVIVRLPA